jgi:hypothetical protein
MMVMIVMVMIVMIVVAVVVMIVMIVVVVVVMVTDDTSCYGWLVIEDRQTDRLARRYRDTTTN